MISCNLVYIDKLANGDENFKMRLIQVIKAELPVEIDVYNTYITDRNYTSAAGMVHKIKHKIIVLGLDNCYTIAEKHEQNLKNNSCHLNSKFEEIINNMLAYIIKL